MLTRGTARIRILGLPRGGGKKHQAPKSRTLARQGPRSLERKAHPVTRWGNAGACAGREGLGPIVDAEEAAAEPRWGLEALSL